MTVPNPFPEELVLQAESRWPLVLPEATVKAVLQRPLPESLTAGATLQCPSGACRASIVVVTYNNLLFNRLCLESVLANTEAGSYELRVVDNGSQDGTAGYLSELARRHPQVQVHLNDRNAGFAVAANQGLKAARGRFLVLLNNDTMVPPGWLELLLRGLGKPGVGMVGPVTNRCGNEAQIDTAYSTWGGFLRAARERARLHAGETLDIRMLTMFCVALRREVFEQTGLLDESYAIGLFEDEDYSLRLKKAGYSLYCLEDTLVHHFGQASIGKLAEAGDYGDLFRKNRRVFEKKWGLAWKPHGRRENPHYRDQVAAVRRIIETTLPAGCSVLVVSRGDEDLLTVSGRNATHFPQNEHGQYAGFHPESSRAAIDHLEQLRASGAQFLLLPATMSWWLQYYLEFAKHLAENYDCVRHGETGFVYQLASLLPLEQDPGKTGLEKSIGLERLNRRLLTLIMPVGDDAGEMERRLRWLPGQRRHPQQWLFIDDSCSDPGIEAMLEQFCEKHRHAAYVRTVKRNNPVAAVNLALQLAPGEVVLLDDACYLSERWLERMSALASSRKAVATVSPATVDETGDVASAPGLLLTRAGIRRIGLLDDQGFSDRTAALADYRERAAAAGFLNLQDQASLAGTCESAVNFTAPDCRSSNKPCLLLLVHAGGGARFASEDLVLSLPDSWRCLLLATGAENWTLFEVLNGELKAHWRFSFSETWRLESDPGPERMAVLEDIHEHAAVDLVNIHHLLGNGPGVIDYFKSLQVPVVFSIHDFYPLCPTAHLVDDRQAYCAGVCTPGNGDCGLNREYFRQAIPGLKHDLVHRHRTRTRSALAKCDAVTAPSLTVKNRLEQFPGFDFRPRFHVISHGSHARQESLAEEPAAGQPARLLCLGNLNAAKGINLIHELMALNAGQGRPFEFHFLGARQGGFRPEDLGGVDHGPYRREDVLQRIREIRPSFSLLAPICEETWSYTLSESWAAGLPVFASNLGALEERIGAHGGGWLLDAGDANAFFSGMVNVLKAPGAWLEAVEAIKRIPFIPLGQEAGLYARLFDRLLSERSLAGTQE